MTGAVSYTDADALAIGSVTPPEGGADVEGLSSTGAAAGKTIVSGDALTISRNINLDTGALNLKAGGTGITVTQEHQ